LEAPQPIYGAGQSQGSAGKGDEKKIEPFLKKPKQMQMRGREVMGAGTTEAPKLVSLH
jgi:hypothetical protein